MSKKKDEPRTYTVPATVEVDGVWLIRGQVYEVVPSRTGRTRINKISGVIWETAIQDIEDAVEKADAPRRAEAVKADEEAAKA